jgi:hypothetical protein
METLKDLYEFLKQRKKWWLLPLIAVLLLVGIIVAVGSSSIAPFIYTIF